MKTEIGYFKRSEGLSSPGKQVAGKYNTLYNIYDPTTWDSEERQRSQVDSCVHFTALQIPLLQNFSRAHSS